MRIYERRLVLTLGFLAGFAFAHPANAVTNFMYGGVYNNWPSSWTSLPGLNDPDDGQTGRFDFIGDSSDACAYWGMDLDYFYFRMRVHDGSPGSNLWGGSFFLLIDQTNVGPSNSLDYAIAWDYKENQQQNHGLELQVTNVVGNSWGATRNSDLDGNGAQKIVPPDFALGGGAGYIRTIDGQNTINFGLSTYIDLAVSWNALTNPAVGCTLAPGQTWRVQLGTTENANDHNWINCDVAANANPADIGLTWGDTLGTVPEPSTVLLAAAGLVVLLGRKFMKR